MVNQSIHDPIRNRIQDSKLEVFDTTPDTIHNDIYDQFSSKENIKSKQQLPRLHPKNLTPDLNHDLTLISRPTFPYGQIP